MTPARPKPQEQNGFHDPVMLHEMIAALSPRAGETYVDGTFGAGGYTRAIINAAPTCHIYAFDRDPDAHARYNALPESIRAACTFVDAPFSQMKEQLTHHNVSRVDGVVLDLGVSSPQLDEAARGFSFRFDGPLDMRMDPRTGESAADVVNTYPEQELADIIYQYGEERQSRAVARAIVAARKTAPITTTSALATLVRSVVRKSPKDTSDAATRTFQALRIFVNAELDELRAVLHAALDLLNEGGRLVVVTFHSLEDRIVKEFFRGCAGRATHANRFSPDTGASPAYITLLSTKAISAGDAELRRNPRARSAHLRACTRSSIPLPKEI